MYRVLKTYGNSNWKRSHEVSEQDCLLLNRLVKLVSSVVLTLIQNFTSNITAFFGPYSAPD